MTTLRPSFSQLGRLYYHVATAAMMLLLAHGCVSTKRRKYAMAMDDFSSRVARSKARESFLGTEAAIAALGEPDARFSIRKTKNLRHRLVVEQFEGSYLPADEALRESLLRYYKAVKPEKVEQWLYDEDRRFGRIDRRVRGLNPPELRNGLLLLVYEAKIIDAITIISTCISRHEEQVDPRFQGY
jgi:hypothetical protein